uniref:Guanylate kinase n=1 Tax=Candidatus Kentrum eta TaxID=2126337 RepID=A0A450VE54_9GAMM|nr:MAG: guanylate kinase [Candidatus Kentron sp. H]VFK00155.1 MAG: guanylate kinase [Candidatus Kentron sp. H]VFK03054.1 MAG: guanylate kinase [Candidatus Kentron sp. H]
MRSLAANDPRVLISISHTTRLPRPGEEDGIDYHFVSEAVFQDIRKRDAFIECAKVFGNYYGTSREWLEGKLHHGFDIILEIDWQGARQIRRKIPGYIGIFVLPPARDVLAQRLLDRGQDDDSVIAKRMQDVASELSHFNEFDYLIVNDDFGTALSDLRAILQAERLRQIRQAQHYWPLIASLLGE